MVAVGTDLQDTARLTMRGMALNDSERNGVADTASPGMARSGRARIGMAVGARKGMARSVLVRIGCQGAGG